MQKKEDARIIIPEGRFEGYCDSCFLEKETIKMPREEYFVKENLVAISFLMRKMNVHIIHRE